MIKINNVNKSYNGINKAVEDISIDIKNGEIFGFIGHNGAGKTTTIKMMTGILNPDSGNILLNEFDITKSPLDAKKQFGFVPDSPDVFLKLKGIEYLNFMADIYKVSEKDRIAKIHTLAEKFELTNVLNDKISSYSHGMRQKLVIIGALIHNPSIWILDEPLTGLDPKSSYILKEMMREHVSKGNTIFFSTHVLEVAEKLCDRIAIINKGKIIFCGNLTELKDLYKDKDSLENIFLEMTKNE